MSFTFSRVIFVLSDESEKNFEAFRTIIGKIFRSRVLSKYLADIRQRSNFKRQFLQGKQIRCDLS